MLGDKIRTKRMEKQLTLKDLAKRTGVTQGFLSQVERGLTDPSITSLRRIAHALDVPIFYFLMEEDESSPVVRKNERKVLKFPDSHLTFELLSPDLNRSLEMMMARLEPGAVTCDVPLTHPGEENILVLQGQMKIQIGDDLQILEEGDSIYYYSGIPHKIWSIGTEDLVFISAITPPAF
ncbi:MAG: MerR family transcriptional regulator [Desulfosporosinus sp. BRH_c37]|nr:MAG: MerR family transcriptional regulator [Desulfosporosinus sp. BRH_c37]